VAGAGRGGGGRQAGQVAAGIFLTRVLGYVRERVTAYYLGNGAAADAIRVALRVPNAIRNLLGEGTLSASFIPVYAALNERADKSAARALAGAVAGVAMIAGARWASAAGAVSTPDSYFPIGVWSQPAYTFDKWQSRGINTVINYEPYGGQDSIDVWSNAANAHGFYQVRTPRANPADDLKETRLLAWMHSDEPDIHKTSPTVLTNEYNAWKAVDPNKPILVNFSGGELLNHTTSNTTYQQYMASSNIISNDFYPVTGWGRPDWIDYSKTITDRKTEGMAIKGYSDLSGGKPQWAFIETSAQKLSWIPNGRGVTPSEFRGEVWDSIINGAKGIAYFPQQIGAGFRFASSRRQDSSSVRFSRQSRAAQLLGNLVPALQNRDALVRGSAKPLRIRGSTSSWHRNG